MDRACLSISSEGLAITGIDDRWYGILRKFCTYMSERVYLEVKAFLVADKPLFGKLATVLVVAPFAVLEWCSGAEVVWQLWVQPNPVGFA